MLKCHHLCFGICGRFVVIVSLLVSKHFICHVAESKHHLSVVCFGYHMCLCFHMYLTVSHRVFVYVADWLCVCVCALACCIFVRVSIRPGHRKVEWWCELQIRASFGLIGLVFFPQGMQAELLCLPFSLTQTPPTMSFSFLFKLFFFCPPSPYSISKKLIWGKILKLFSAADLIVCVAALAVVRS